MGKLTTHILDTSMGTPAKEVEIKLYKRNDSSLKLINSAKTNEDGRCNEPLLSGNLFEEGCYEIEFNIGHYYVQNIELLIIFRKSRIAFDKLNI